MLCEIRSPAAHENHGDVTTTGVRASSTTAAGEVRKPHTARLVPMTAAIDNDSRRNDTTASAKGSPEVALPAIGVNLLAPVIAPSSDATQFAYAA